jgi:hypothetical protein
MVNQYSRAALTRIPVSQVRSRATSIGTRTGSTTQLMEFVE